MEWCFRTHWWCLQVLFSVFNFQMFCDCSVNISFKILFWFFITWFRNSASWKRVKTWNDVSEHVKDVYKMTINPLKIHKLQKVLQEKLSKMSKNKLKSELQNLKQDNLFQDSRFKILYSRTQAHICATKANKLNTIKFNRKHQKQLQLSNIDWSLVPLRLQIPIMESSNTVTKDSSNSLTVSIFLEICILQRKRGKTWNKSSENKLQKVILVLHNLISKFCLL
jgi:hypothetical protein